MYPGLDQDLGCCPWFICQYIFCIQGFSNAPPLPPPTVKIPSMLDYQAITFSCWILHKVTWEICGFFILANYPSAIFFYPIRHFNGLSFGPSFIFNGIDFSPIISGLAFSKRWSCQLFILLLHLTRLSLLFPSKVFQSWQGCNCETHIFCSAIIKRGRVGEKLICRLAVQ